MATISVTIPDDALPRVRAALARAGGWDGVTGTEAQAARHAIAVFVRQTTLNVERNAAEARALEAVSVDPVDVT